MHRFVRFVRTAPPKESPRVLNIPDRKGENLTEGEKCAESDEKVGLGLFYLRVGVGNVALFSRFEQKSDEKSVMFRTVPGALAA